MIPNIFSLVLFFHTVRSVKNGFALRLNFVILMNFNKVWTQGIDFSYFSCMMNSKEQENANPPHIDEGFYSWKFI